MFLRVLFFCLPLLGLYNFKSFAILFLDLIKDGNNKINKSDVDDDSANADTHIHKSTADVLFFSKKKNFSSWQKLVYLDNIAHTMFLFW